MQDLKTESKRQTNECKHRQQHEGQQGKEVGKDEQGKEGQLHGDGERLDFG